MLKKSDEITVMGSLSRLEVTVARQVYLPASEKVRGEKERVGTA
jgi:hypothetical protein